MAGDSRGRQSPRRGSRSRSPRRRTKSPPRRRGGSRRRTRSPIPYRGGGTYRPNAPAKGEFKVTVENIPSDMTWTELKDFGHKYVKTVTFARTFYNRDSVACGVLEVKDQEDRDKLYNELDGRRVQGCTSRLKVIEGDLSRECRRY